MFQCENPANYLQTHGAKAMTKNMEDTIEIHKDALDSNDIIVLHDDLLATGGTMLAAYNLVKRFNPKKIYVNFIIELEFLKGRNVFPSEIEIEALIKY